MAVFARKSIDYEFSVTNEIVQKERFRYFIKVPELASFYSEITDFRTFYSEITDFRTAVDIGIDRPKKNEILHNIAPTPDQQEFIAKLMEFAMPPYWAVRRSPRKRKRPRCLSPPTMPARCRLTCGSSTR